MILHLGRSRLPMKLSNFSSGLKIRQEVADLNWDAESCGTEKTNYNFLYSALALRLLELYRNNPDSIVTCAQFNEMATAVGNYLEDLSILRPSSSPH